MTLSAQTIFSAKPSRRRFATIDRDMLINTNLSSDHRILLAICTVQEEGWEVNRDELLRLLGWGDSKLKMNVADLIKLGYCIRTQSFDPATGRFLRTSYQFSSESPSVENQPTVKIENLTVNNIILINQIFIENDAPITQSERESILAEADKLPADRGQLVVDELIGALRSRGKNPPEKQGIRNVRSYFAALLKRGQEFNYAQIEKELRERRAEQKKLRQVAINQTAASTPPPDEYWQLLRQRKGVKNAK